MAITERLRLRKETTYGTYDAGGTTLYIELSAPNSFSVRRTPVLGTIRTPAAGNRPAKRHTSRHLIQGSLRTLLYHTQAADLLAWAFTPTANVLPSWTADYYDGVYYRRYTGLRVASCTITGEAEAEESRVVCTFNLMGQTDATITIADFAAPAYTDYPSGIPYVFQEAGASGLKVGTTQARYNMFSINVENKLLPATNVLAYPDDLYYRGRDVKLSFRPEYSATTLRTAFRDQTTLDSELTLTQGGNSVKFDIHDTVYIDTLEDALGWDEVDRQPITLAAMYSSSNTTDLTITIV